jgi:CxxC motif-containing protein (DUF1111 family)/uncharacterized protein YjdB
VTPPPIASGWPNKNYADVLLLQGSAFGHRWCLLRVVPRFYGSSMAAAIFCVIALLVLCSQASGQSVTLTPAAVAFTNQIVNTTSPVKNVTLTNSGSALLTLSISIAGDFSQTNTCGSSVAAGKNCTISVSFTPTTTGARTGTLTFSDNAVNSPQTVSLSGTGLLPASVSLSSVTFGPQVLGTTSAAKAVSLTNNQSVTLAISSITPTGDFVQTNTCGGSLGAKSNCTINITFAPTAVGARTGAITITDSATNSPQVISLTGTGSAVKLNSITVTPKSPSLPVGSKLQFTATGNYNNGTTQDLSNSVTWTASENIVVVSLSSTGFATALAPGSVTIKAIVGTIVGVSFLTVTAPALVSIAVTPAIPSILAGTTQQFTATGTYTDGSTANLTNSVSWSSSNATVATISSTGLASTSSQGTTTINATFGSVTGSTLLTARPPSLASISVTPNNASIALGTTQQFTATGTYTDGSTQNLTMQVTWASSSSNVTISGTQGSNGLATTVAQGSATITATLGSINGLTSLNVTPAALVSIAITPSSASVAQGVQQQFTATGTFTDNSAQNITVTVLWSSSSTSVATISNAPASQGWATSLAQGSTTITATSGSVTNSVTLTVLAPALVSITVNPNSPAVALGTTQQFTATGTYTDGSSQDLTSSATWNSSAPNVVSISNAQGTQGLATAVAQGSTTIAATSGSVSGGTVVTVASVVVTSVSVNPSSASIPLGATQQFTATGTFSDGSTQDLTQSVHWSAGDGTVATISNSAPTQGLATPVGQGVVQVTANLNSISGMTQLTITAATLQSIAVTPANPSLALGTPQQFTATGTFSDGSTQNLTSSASWTSLNPSVAIITATGLASSAGVGTSTIVATSGSISGSTTLTFFSAQPTLVSITVTPSNASIALGTSQQFTATGLYTDGSTLNLTAQVNWASSSPNVTISNGVATTVAQGSATITATLGSISGFTSLTVTPVALLSIAITPASASVAPGVQQQFTATGAYTDNSTQNLTATVLWSTSSTSIATVSNSASTHGLATAVGQGTVTVIATLGVTSASAQLAVIPILGSILPGLNSTEQRMVFLPITGGQALFDLLWKPAGDGFGPLYTQPGCSQCHSTPVLGGAGSVQVTRFGKLNPDGSFNTLANEGGPVLHPNSVGAQPASSLQHLQGCTLPGNSIPSDATIISLRQTPPVFGDGFIDAIPDSTILANQIFQANDPVSQSLGIHGVANMILDLAGNLRPGRFGWKAQQATLLGFSGEAELVELGISNPEFPNENQPQFGTIPPSCEVARSEPNDPAGVANNLTVNFAAFAAFLAPPIPAPPTFQTLAGQQTLASIGCANCHMQSMQTQMSFQLPRDFPKPLGSGTTETSIVLSNQTANLFSDLLLHDMGPGLNDSTPQGQASGSQWRTTPLWGLSHKVLLLHDGRCTGPNAILCAIQAHAGEASAVVSTFLGLTPDQQAGLLAFLNSL